jgi:glycosyltransferase involved in cell wall biosynthesis
VTEPLISIVLPVYHQADHIAAIIERYETALARLPYSHECILVVNGEGDRSPEVCQALAEQYEPVRTIFSAEPGWGRAVRTGLAAARGELLCYTNSARTQASDLTLLILYAIANPGAIVKAHRRSRESWDRKIGSFLYNLECRALFDLPTWDINATPKVFSAEVYAAIQPQADGDLIDLEFYVKCKQLDIVILEVPIYSMTRHGGKSTTNYRSALSLYQGAFQLWQSLRENGR